MCGLAAGEVAGAAAPGEGVGSVGRAGALSVRVQGHGAPPGAAVCEGRLGRAAGGPRAGEHGARMREARGAGVGRCAVARLAARAARRSRGRPGHGAARGAREPRPQADLIGGGLPGREPPDTAVEPPTGCPECLGAPAPRPRPWRGQPRRVPAGGGPGVRRHAPVLERPQRPPLRQRRALVGLLIARHRAAPPAGFGGAGRPPRHAAATGRPWRSPRRPAPPPRPPDAAAAPAASWRDPGRSTGPQPPRGSDCRLPAQETAQHPRRGPPAPLHVRASFPPAQGRKPRNQPQLGPQWRGAVLRGGSAPPAHTHEHSSISPLHSPATQAGV